MNKHAARLTIALTAAGVVATSGAVAFAIGRQTIPASQLFSLADAATGELTQRLELASLLHSGGRDSALKRNAPHRGAESSTNPAIGAGRTTGQTAAWASIVPQKTTQAELTKLVGPPDEVIATFPWTEWSAVWKKRPVSRFYNLRYASASRSPLMQGPAGPADSVEVNIGDKTVMAVVWHHRGPSARAALAALRADPDMNETSVSGTGPKFSKDVQGGWLAGWVDDGEIVVRVVFEMK